MKKRIIKNDEKFCKNATDCSHINVQEKVMIETRPTGSGFNSFLRWFKKNEKARQHNSKIKSLNDNNIINEINLNNNNNNNNTDADTTTINSPIINNNISITSKFESNETLSSPSSPILGRKSIASSCDSVFSTATLGFAFVSPVNYRPFGDASQPEKLIAPGPITETYRKRIKEQEKVREVDKQLELTLRSKYKLFQGNENRLLAAEEEPQQIKYSEYSLPNFNKKYLLESEDEENTTGDNETNSNNTKKHRRTCSDSTKDKKSGAYVHVKGKRKAPPPPPATPPPATPPPAKSSLSSLNSNNNSNTLRKIVSTTPSSTLSRKKRRAPPPPININTQNDIPEPIFTQGFLEDKEIKALIEPEIEMDDFKPTKPLTDEQKQIVIDNIVKNQQPTILNDDILTNDTLKLEKGILRSNKDISNIDTAAAQLKKDETQAPLSPISPRPWYKRPLSGTRDSSIPFKKEIILKTVDKRKNKKDKNDDLPEFGFSRNSLFESATKFGFFRSSSSTTSSTNSDDAKNRRSEIQEKRKSGIGIPSISELDREAAEIVSTAQATEKARIQQENEKYYQSPNEFALESKMLGIVADDQTEDRKSAKELISKFEANSNNQKITINTSFIGRSDLFENKTKPTSPILEQRKLVENLLDNKMERKPDILGLWTCPFCTLENPNWRIICEACEKIKPYDLRFNSTQNTNNTPNLLKSVASPVKITSNPSVLNTNMFASTTEAATTPTISEWDKKTEKVRKYFNLPSRLSGGNNLSKSSSETSLGTGTRGKFIKNDSKFGSPKFGLRNLPNSRDKYDNIRTQTSLDESKLDRLETLDEKKEEINYLQNTRDVVLTTTVTTVFEPPSVVVRNESPKKYDTAREEKRTPELQIKERPKTEIVEKISPDLEEVRKARLSHFTPNEVKKVPESSEKVPAISSHDELEKEKERLREMIRQMNARALAEKYPVVKTPPGTMSSTSTKPVCSSPIPIETEVITTPTVVAVIPKTQQQTNNDATKLGAIKKLFARKETPKQQQQPAPPPKSINSDDSVLLPYLSQSKNYDNIEKNDLLQNQNTHYENCPIYENLKDPVLHNMHFTPQQTAKVEEITTQLQSQKGVDDFKATLRSSKKSINNTNTLAINKILRNLENAIADGEYELAASLAKNLARMKVTLSVTRQKDRPLSGTDFINDEIISTQLFIDDSKSRRGPLPLNISPSIKIFEFKKQVTANYELPENIKLWIVNGQHLTNDDLTLSNFGIIKNHDIINLSFEFNEIVQEKFRSPAKIQNDLNRKLDSKKQNDLNRNADDNKQANNVVKTISDSDDDIQNEKVGLNEEKLEDGAVGITVPDVIKQESSKKGWSCPLCTLINIPNRSNCAACSESRPTSFIIPNEYRENVNHIADELKTFLEIETITSSGSKKNDLNRRPNPNRNSTEVMNIQFDERFDIKASPSKIPIKTLSEPLAIDFVKRPTNTSIVMTVLNNPNITKNKYRGVNNYNPKYAPFTKSTESITLIQTEPIQMEAKNVIKSVKKCAAPQPPQRANHYLELLNLDQTDLVSNFEPFECKICFIEYGKGEGVILRECLHIFCRICLSNTIQYSDEVEIKCPYMDDQYSCDSMLQDREVKGLVTREIYELHLAKSVQQAEHKIENAFHCKTPNCKAWCIYEDNVNQFKCPVCRITNCLTCQAIHDGLNCKQYQDRINSGCDTNLDANRTKEMLQDMVNKGEAMNCPTCQVILMKKWGCDWLKCSMCKTEICWVTRGPRWGPGGKGDTTGGCKCGVNGKKCHTQCNYCH